ncbi:hypothetical protein GCM10011575_06300 [Microlunatus endophyticus]|uniref:Uncharacterized protein n=1 Tax=Microlunatus endophyticus TaxID=1716077 RepID=A0A917W068_9ACTN|nr:hypothetical protein [Microlunatus endophyticus]GGL50779.1 hypothetical protein GCM10011575_06300 [Microlunatus endophyticus]
MSAATLERPAVAARSAGTTRTRQLRPGRGSGRAGRPVTRSVSGVQAPMIGRDRHPSAGARACRPEVAARPVSATSVPSAWQLTNRGIAVVLIAGALLAAAAITVITATAITVTSDGYHSHGSALVRR